MIDKRCRLFVCSSACAEWHMQAGRQRDGRPAVDRKASERTRRKRMCTSLSGTAFTNIWIAKQHHLQITGGGSCMNRQCHEKAGKTAKRKGSEREMGSRRMSADAGIRGSQSAGLCAVASCTGICKQHLSSVLLFFVVALTISLCLSLLAMLSKGRIHEKTR